MQIVSRAACTLAALIGAATACFQCHTAQKAHAYVFSAYRP
jgi:hypothetical protein